VKETVHKADKENFNTHTVNYHVFHKTLVKKNWGECQSAPLCGVSADLKTSLTHIKITSQFLANMKYRILVSGAWS
jgi:hypothetical protein